MDGLIDKRNRNIPWHYDPKTSTSSERHAAQVEIRLICWTVHDLQMRMCNLAAIELGPCGGLVWSDPKVRISPQMWQFMHYHRGHVILMYMFMYILLIWWKSTHIHLTSCMGHVATLSKRATNHETR